MDLTGYRLSLKSLVASMAFGVVITCMSCSKPVQHPPVTVTCIAINGHLCMILKEMNVLIALREIPATEGMLMGGVVHFQGGGNLTFTLGTNEITVTHTETSIIVAHGATKIEVDDSSIRVLGGERVLPHEPGRAEAFIVEQGTLSKATGRDEFAYTSALRGSQ